MDDLRLPLVDPAEDVQARRPAIGAGGRGQHLDIVVALDDAIGDLAGGRLAVHRVVVRGRAFSRSISAAKPVSDGIILSMAESSVRSRSSR